MTNLVKNYDVTVSSREIAKITGKLHKNVLDSIRTMEPAWEKVTGLKFKPNEYTDARGRKLPMYELDKRESLYVATKFNDEARARLILRWEELENKSTPNLYMEQYIGAQSHFFDNITTMFNDLKDIIVKQQKLIENPVLDTKNLITVKEFLIEAGLHIYLPFVAKIGMKAKTFSILNHIQHIKYTGSNYYTAKAIQYGVNAITDIDRSYVLDLKNTRKALRKPVLFIAEDGRKSNWHLDIFNLSVGKTIYFDNSRIQAMKQHILRYKRSNPNGMRFLTTTRGTPVMKFAVKRTR